MKKLESSYRSHTCDQLRTSDVGTEVTLSGWLQRKRDHGGVVFVDLRDHYGVTQVVFNDNDREAVQKIRPESVLKISGKVLKRDDELVNPKISTGQVEVHCDKLEVLSDAQVLPFLVFEDDNAPEAARLKHRFIELRRKELHENIKKRCEIITAIRSIMNELGFAEYQTPILTSSSPEGARDFIVPSRLHPGKFFALPQAPQQFKQLLMVSGFDRYFQIAPCFRDEDSRADRSPGEFYQIDMEMSFVEQDDVLEANETLAHKLFTQFADGRKVTERNFPRIPYNDALATYGSDKPDLRNPLKIQDVSEVFQNTDFKVFKGVLDDGGSVQAIKVELPEVPARKYFDDTIEWSKRLTGQGVAYLSYDYSNGGECRGAIKKFFTDEEVEALRKKLGIETTASVFFSAGPTKTILPWLGKLLTKLGDDFDLLEKDAFRLCWITDYPLYEIDEQTGKLDFSHNPFSMPRGGLKALEEQDPLEIYSDQYDLVCNGYELGSGAIRNHSAEIMYKAFEIAGYDRSVVDDKFGGMLRAFSYGAPPHGGFAHGVERIVMLLCGETAIREVIPFPLAQTGEDLLMKAPSDVTEQQLKEVHIQLDLPEEEQILKETG